jgi:hypothetical protein
MSSEEEDPYKRLLGTLGGSAIQSLSKKMKLDVADDSSQSLEAESYSDSNDGPGSASDESVGSDEESLGSVEDVSGEEEDESEEEGEESGSQDSGPAAEGDGDEEEEEQSEEDDEEEPDLPEEPLVAGSQTSTYLQRFSDRPDKELQALIDRQPKLKSRSFEVH